MTMFLVQTQGKEDNQWTHNQAAEVGGASWGCHCSQKFLECGNQKGHHEFSGTEPAGQLGQWLTRRYLRAHWLTDFSQQCGVLHPSHDLSMLWGYWNASLHHCKRKQTQSKQIFLMVKTASFSQNQNHISFWGSARSNSERLNAFEKGDKPLGTLHSWAKM